MQILVQVLATVIECGTVTDTSAVVSFEDFQRPPPGFVTVEEAVDAPVPVQVFHRLAYVGDGVQHKAVAIAAYAECVSGQKVHETLEHAAYVRGGIFRYYQ